jgi:hypothetical protein
VNGAGITVLSGDPGMVRARDGLNLIRPVAGASIPAADGVVR